MKFVLSSAQGTEYCLLFFARLTYKLIYCVDKIVGALETVLFLVFPNRHPGATPFTPFRFLLQWRNKGHMKPTNL